MNRRTDDLQIILPDINNIKIVSRFSLCCRLLSNRKLRIAILIIICSFQRNIFIKIQRLSVRKYFIQIKGLCLFPLCAIQLKLTGTPVAFSLLICSLRYNKRQTYSAPTGHLYIAARNDTVRHTPFLCTVKKLLRRLIISLSTMKS